jgi:raffinose/stachyose/melibiose transport system permease protein
MQKRKHKIFNEAQWLTFILPVLLVYTLIMLVPFLRTIYYSFTDWDGITSRFIGLDNFKNLIFDNTIKTSFFNTAFYSITITILQNMLGLILAIFMVKKLFGQNILRTLFFMPNIFSALLLGYVWSFILDPNVGIVNNLLSLMHLGAFQQDWLGNPFWGRIMICMLTIWQCTGYSMVIYISGLQAIPADLYEAAEIDGAKPLARFRFVTFPLVAPAFTINIILSLIGTFKIFDPIYALTNGGPGYSTDSVASMIYKLAFTTKNEWGYGTAMSVTLFVFILIITSIIVPLLRKREVEF